MVKLIILVMKQMTSKDSGTISAQFAIEHTQFCGSYFIHIYIYIFFGGGVEGNIKVIFDVINLRFFSWRYNPLLGLGLHPHSARLFFPDHTRHTTVCRTPLDE